MIRDDLAEEILASLKVIGASVALLEEHLGVHDDNQEYVLRTVREISTKVSSAIPPKRYSPREAAEALRVSVPTVRRWIKSGRLPAFKEGNRVIVDLGTFLDRRASAAREAA